MDIHHFDSSFLTRKNQLIEAFKMLLSKRYFREIYSPPFIMIIALAKKRGSMAFGCESRLSLGKYR